MFKRNKRKHPRQRSFNLVKLTDLGNSTALVPTNNLANILNISEGGLRFTSPHLLPLESSLKLTINLGEANRQIEVKGDVVWVHKMKGQRRYHYGIRFTDISDGDRKLIRRVVKHSGSFKLWFRDEDETR